MSKKMFNKKKVTNYMNSPHLCALKRRLGSLEWGELTTVSIAALIVSTKDSRADSINSHPGSGYWDTVYL